MSFTLKKNVSTSINYNSNTGIGSEHNELGTKWEWWTHKYLMFVQVITKSISVCLQILQSTISPRSVWIFGCDCSTFLFCSTTARWEYLRQLKYTSTLFMFMLDLHCKHIHDFLIALKACPLQQLKIMRMFQINLQMKVYLFSVRVTFYIYYSCFNSYHCPSPNYELVVWVPRHAIIGLTVFTTTKNDSNYIHIERLNQVHQP